MMLQQRIYSKRKRNYRSKYIPTALNTSAVYIICIHPKEKKRINVVQEKKYTNCFPSHSNYKVISLQVPLLRKASEQVPNETKKKII